jgi:hypothetical protein
MLYTVAEISNLTNLSKVSIYNKLKLKEVHEHITKKQGVSYIDEIGLNLIKDSLKLNDDDLNDLDNNDIDSSVNEDISVDEDTLNIKSDYINYLKVENERLWEELKDKNLQISNLQRLVENGQILLKDKPQQDIKLLEEHFKDLDNNLLEVRKRMEQRKENQQQKANEHKNIFQKIFKR